MEKQHKVRNVDVKKVRNVNSPKGRRKEFTDDITLTIGNDTYQLKVYSIENLEVEEMVIKNV